MRIDNIDKTNFNGKILNGGALRLSSHDKPMRQLIHFLKHNIGGDFYIKKAQGVLVVDESRKIVGKAPECVAIDARRAAQLISMDGKIDEKGIKKLIKLIKDRKEWFKKIETAQKDPSSFNINETNDVAYVIQNP